MKKLHVIAGLIMVAVLGFAAASPAGEASFFDQATGWIIRAYTAGASVPYSVNIEAVDTTNNHPEGVSFTCTGASGAGTGNPAPVADDAANTDISMSFDDAWGTAYVFYTSQAGLQLPKCTLAGGPPPDTETPTVGITSPSNGATVSGTAVTLSANASDNVGVAGVQFKVDGNNVGAEDTTAPYSVSWNSTTVLNGDHTVTAVARDAAGNSTTSAGVTVNVSNGGGGGSSVDLVITKLEARSPGGASIRGWDNGVPFDVVVAIKNNGSAASGPFKVKFYFSSDSNPDPADFLLLTGPQTPLIWTVSGLNGGQTQEQTFTVYFVNVPIHASYYVVAAIDADNEVAESNEGNNVKVGPYINVSR